MAKITDRLIERCRNRFEAGDKTALLDAVDFCARSGTVMPVWLAESYCACYTEDKRIIFKKIWTEFCKIIDFEIKKLKNAK